MRINAPCCAIVALALAACEDRDKTDPYADDGGDEATAPDGPTPGVPREDVGGPAYARDSRCLADDGSISLMPPRWCASVAADDLGEARHLAVSGAGDVYVATLADDGGQGGGIWALRDADDDGVAEQQELIYQGSGSGIAHRFGSLWFGEDDRILRFDLPDGTLAPTGEPVTVVSGLPIGGDHDYKSIVVARDGSLYVNIGSPSNSCQEENRVEGSPGLDPCPELATRAGIWRFDARGQDQVQDDGVRVATGIRNANALALQPTTGELVAVVNGRDQLFENWPDLFTAEDDRLAPSEELLVVQEGADYGWPYCYHDPRLDQKVLAPEYGGDGETIGRCASAMPPDAVFPAHWAPLAIEFLQGPEVGPYRGGALVTFHGSRFEEDPDGRLPGYSVGFVPFDRSGPRSRGYLFAYDFAGEDRPLPEGAEFRPVGVAQAPDGTIYVSDDVRGRIWRIYPPVATAF